MSILNQNTLIGATPIGSNASSIFDSLLVARMSKHWSVTESKHWVVQETQHFTAVMSSHWRVVFHGRGDI